MKYIRIYLIGVAIILLASGCVGNANKIDPNDPAAGFLGHWVSPDALGTMEVMRDENGLALIPDIYAADVIRLEEKEGCLYSMETEGTFAVKICPVREEDGEGNKLTLEAGKQQIYLHRTNLSK